MPSTAGSGGVGLLRAALGHEHGRRGGVRIVGRDERDHGLRHPGLPVSRPLEEGVVRRLGSECPESGEPPGCRLLARRQ